MKNNFMSYVRMYVLSEVYLVCYLRLYSIAGVNMRITQEDVVLSGYHVPTGVCVC